MEGRPMVCPKVPVDRNMAVGEGLLQRAAFADDRMPLSPNRLWRWWVVVSDLPFPWLQCAGV